MTQVQALYITAVAYLRVQVGQLRKESERGAGGNTLEILLLAIGGVIVAGIVVAAVLSSVNSKTDQLNP